MISNFFPSNFGMNRWTLQYLLVLTLMFTLTWAKKASSFDTKDLERLQQTNSCQNCNLKEANLAGAALIGANLEGANLQGANLEGANLENANLKKANLKGVSKPTILTSANLKNADLSEAKLNGAILFKANLEGANLSRSDLSVVLVRLLDTMSIHCTDLREANFSGANFSHANLKIKVLVGDIWIRHLHKLGFNRDRIRVSNSFSQMFIVHGGTPLKTEKICNPALVDSNFSRANLKDAVLEGIELNQIVLCETTMPDGSVSNAKCPSSLKK